jgi:hypothetical protein
MNATPIVQGASQAWPDVHERCVAPHCVSHAARVLIVHPPNSLLQQEPVVQSTLQVWVPLHVYGAPEPERQDV